MAPGVRTTCPRSNRPSLRSPPQQRRQGTPHVPLLAVLLDGEVRSCRRGRAYSLAPSRPAGARSSRGRACIPCRVCDGRGSCNSSRAGPPRRPLPLWRRRPGSGGRACPPACGSGAGGRDCSAASPGCPLPCRSWPLARAWAARSRSSSISIRSARTSFGVVVCAGGATLCSVKRVPLLARASGSLQLRRG